MPRSFFFRSSRNPNKEYETIVYDDGLIVCDCPSRYECWHMRSAREQAKEPERPMVSTEDQRTIVGLLAEGNDKGATEAARALFPSMSDEEVKTLIEEMVRDFDAFPFE